jgi:hypothetical protein
MAIAVGLFGAGVVSGVASLIYAITFKVGPATVFIFPYGTQVFELLLSGIEVGLFSMLFFWVDYSLQNQRKLRIKLDSSPR